MGFHLWIDGEIAWAAGTYEYRAMGTAIISKTDKFRARDFARNRRAPSPSSPAFIGNFASMVHLNAYLRTIRARHTRK
jgi:hypothetical protein